MDQKHNLAMEIIGSYHEEVSRVLGLGNIGLNTHAIDDPERLHSEACRKLFAYALSGDEGVWIRFERENDFSFLNRPHQIDGEKENAAGKIYISILSERQYEYDASSFRALRAIQEITNDAKETVAYVRYRPYFFSFIVDAREISRHPRLLEWIEKNFTEDNLNNQFDRIGWIQARFENDGTGHDWRVREESDIALDGIVEYAASPFVFKKGTLHISTDAKGHPKAIDASKQAEIEGMYHDCLKQCMNNPGAQSIKAVISNALNNVSIKCLEIFSVGTANAMILHGTSGASVKAKQIVFDIGIRGDTTKKGNSSFPQRIKKLKPDIVILSHWDSDHVFGCAYGSSDLFLCPWIAPNPALSNWSICAGSERVACYLACLNNLFLCDNVGSRIVKVSGSQSSLEIWQGAGRPDGSITMQNRIGLILLIRREIAGRPDIIEALLPGDVPYSSFPDPLYSNNSVRFLAIPHHCAEMNLGWLDSILNRKARKFAISCTQMDHADYDDIANSANQPSVQCPNRRFNSSSPVKTDPAHINKLRDRNFLVFPTGQVSEELLCCFRNGALFLMGRKPFKENKFVYYLS